MSVSNQDLKGEQTHYDVLQVSKNATMDEISRAYRQRAYHLHPDRNTDSRSEELMKKLNTAKNVLLSGTERAKYDKELQQQTTSTKSSAIFNPAGVISFKNIRFSEMLVLLYNQQKESFEQKHIPGLGNFHTTTKGTLDQVLAQINLLEPPKLACYPQASEAMPQSSLQEILNATKDAISFPRLISVVQQICECILHIQKVCHSQVSSEGSLTKGGLVPIWDVSCISIEHSHFLLSLFEELTDMPSSKQTCDNRLITFLPHVAIKKPNKTPDSEISHCSTCNGNTSEIKTSCSNCSKQFCSHRPLQSWKFSQLGHMTPQPLCLACVSELNALEQESWIDKGIQFLKVETFDAIRAALGCMLIASCIHTDHTKPMIQLAHSLRSQHLPELAIPLTAFLLQNLPTGKSHLKSQMLMGSILQSAAELCKTDYEAQEFLFHSANEAYISVEEHVSSHSSSIEVPNLKPKLTVISDKLSDLKAKQQSDYQLQVNTIYSKLERHWYANDWKNLLVYITSNRKDVPVAMQALDNFLESKSQARNKTPQDREALDFLAGVLKIYRGNILPGLSDIEKVAWKSRSQWLNEAAVEVVVSILDEGLHPSFSELLHTLKQACLGGGSTLLAEHEHSSSTSDRGLALLFPTCHELSPPFEINWPELSNENHARFEHAIATQVREEKISKWEAGRLYVDYVPACREPVEVALCFLHASFWFLKDLETNTVTNDCHKFALKEVVTSCLKHVTGIASLGLHVGMQMYVSRLSLGVLLHTLRLTPSWTTNSDRKLLAQLLHKMLYTHRFCPFWQFPPVSLSEVSILDGKINLFSSHFLLALQHVDPFQRPISEKELKYQLFEYDLCHIQPLKDSESICAQAMLSLLEEKGWSWNDIITTMTSEFSPRDSEGWLIQQPKLGLHMPYAKIEGFILNTQSHAPSIEIVIVPADPNQDQVGLLSFEDVATVFQLDENEQFPIFFSLDPPCADQTFHPFQELRFSSEKKLENTLLLQTLFETDYYLKSFSVGSEVSSVPPFNQRPINKGLTKNLPQDLQKVLKPVSKRGDKVAKVSRFWIQVDDLVYDREQNGSRIEYRVKDLDMKIRTHPLIAGLDGKLQDTEEASDPNSPELQFANDLTTHFNEIGLHFPMFARLRELSKLQFLGVVLQHELQIMAGRNPAFSKQVSNLKASAIDHMKHKVPNPCRWVPAAFDKETHDEYVSLCYGGVLIAPTFKLGRVRPFSSGSVPVKVDSSSFIPTRSAHTQAKKSHQKVLQMSSTKTSYSGSSDGGSQSGGGDEGSQSGGGDEGSQSGSGNGGSQSGSGNGGSQSGSGNGGSQSLSSSGNGSYDGYERPSRSVKLLSPQSTLTKQITRTAKSTVTHSKERSAKSSAHVTRTTSAPVNKSSGINSTSKQHRTTSTGTSNRLTSVNIDSSSRPNVTTQTHVPPFPRPQLASLAGAASSSKPHSITQTHAPTSSKPQSTSLAGAASSSKPHSHATTSPRPLSTSLSGAASFSTPHGATQTHASSSSRQHGTSITGLASSSKLHGTRIATTPSESNPSKSPTSSTTQLTPSTAGTTHTNRGIEQSNDTLSTLPSTIVSAMPMSGNSTTTPQSFPEAELCDILSQPWQDLAVSSNGRLGHKIYDINWERLFGRDNQLSPTFPSSYQKVLSDGISFFCEYSKHCFLSTAYNTFPTDELAVLATLSGVVCNAHVHSDISSNPNDGAPSTHIQLVDETTQLRHAAITPILTNTPCREYKRPCKCCNHIVPLNCIQLTLPSGTEKKADIRVDGPVDCQTKGVVYAIINRRTSQVVYIGMTTRRLSDRFREHLLNVKNFDPAKDDEKSIAYYFNKISSIQDFAIATLFHSKGVTQSSQLKEMETCYINYFELIEFGLNKNTSSKSGEKIYKEKFQTTDSED